MTKPYRPDADTSASAAEAWQSVRDSADIQFSPLQEVVASPRPEREPSQWLKWLGEALEAIFKPIGKLLGMSWPIFQYVLIAIGVLIALFLLWQLLVKPLWFQWQTRKPRLEGSTWQPDRVEAVALLEEADRLAAEHRFADAVHLLLQRSIHHIREARPNALTVASTAREIATLKILPDTGRAAFWTIAERVERALYALRPLDGTDWQAARHAYVEFARLELVR